MKEIYYTYNNEAIASCVFLEFLQKPIQANKASVTARQYN
jgi:hypothetical protein